MSPALLLAAPLAAGLAAAGPAEPLDVRVHVDRREVRLGERFTLTVEIRDRPGERYAPPPFPPDGPFRLLSAACAPRADGPATVTTCALGLALLELGARDLPELAFPAAGPSGSRTLRVPGPTITGEGVIDPAAAAEGLRLRDLPPPAPVLVPDRRLLLALPAAALLLAGAVALKRRRRRAGRAGEPPAPAPPHERLARALAEARRHEGRDPGALVVRISEAVRAHVGSIAGMPARELTSRELLARLSFQPDPRIDTAALGRLLAAADLVKFARAPGDAAEATAALAFARALLERTRPAAAPPREGP